MKIAIIGYSGSGKSTLAATLGEKRGLPVLHMDRVHWLPGWKARDREEKIRIVTEFLDSHDSWVIDGNYARVCGERRFEEADRIVALLFGRLACYRRVRKRLKAYRGKSRPDMGEGCEEKVDWEFTKWVLFGGRTKERRALYRDLAARYPDKVTVVRNQRQLDRLTRELTAAGEKE